ncbi:MAG: type I DNA topoisomerase [bacterium]|nr:type I DNA topoisomerase [bacterium]
MKSLVIVESPTKAKTLGKFLGHDFLIKASFGHVKDLPKRSLGVDIDDNFKTHYQVIKGKDKVLEEIKSLSKHVSSIYLATDPDREGEAIGWHIAEELDGKCVIYRIILHEITEEAVFRALRSPGKIDLNKVWSQTARRILDRLVGYKISPLLWKKVRAGLSAGRVQSAAVRLICDLEHKIEEFIEEEYWEVEARLQDGGISFRARLHSIDGKKVELRNKEEVDRILSILRSERFQVCKISSKDKRRFPPPPFTTSTLQQEAVKGLAFSVKKTMEIAQMLYEGIEIGEEGPIGLITYMRTDSIRVEKAFVEKTREFIGRCFGKDFLPERPHVYKSRRGAQEAHEAIRPTSLERTPDKIKRYLTEDQYRLYRLIWERFLGSQMKEARFKITTVDIKAGEYLFRAVTTDLRFPGYTKVYLEEEKKEEKEETSILPNLSPNSKLSLIELCPKQHFTRPPGRFTEASLVKCLEEEGIGRPSTYVTIISTILSRGYVRKEKGRFYPTELGLLVNGLLMENFPEILDIKFTASLEEELDKIEEGKVSWVDVLREFWKGFSTALENAKRKMQDVKKEQEKETEEICPECNGRLVVKTNRYGDNFLSCSSYPKCRFAKPIGIGVDCPACGGEIIHRYGKKGRRFFGCSNYPECNFLSFDEPTYETCPECGKMLVRKKGRGYLACIACGYLLKRP